MENNIKENQSSTTNVRKKEAIKINVKIELWKHCSKHHNDITKNFLKEVIRKSMQIKKIFLGSITIDKKLFDQKLLQKKQLTINF